MFSFLFLLYSTFLLSALSHKGRPSRPSHQCAHNDHNYSLDIMDTDDPLQGRLLQSYENIRILFDFSSFQGSAQSREYIETIVLPPAQNLLQAVLKVQRHSTNITTGQSVCDGVITPDIYRVPGVDIDLLIFVTSVNSMSIGYKALANACSLHNSNKRPFIGKLQYNLYHIYSTTDDVQIQEDIYTTIHEIIHILGFSNSLYEHYWDPVNNQHLSGHIFMKSVLGQSIKVLNLPSLTSRIRTHFGCSTADGAYLEAEGGTSSIGSHFERRIFYNEMMTASSLMDSRFSEFTLALLEGTGWYQVDYSYAEKMTYGAGETCAFFDSKCMNVATQTPAFQEFCYPLFALQPTWTKRGVGHCGAPSIYADSSLRTDFDYWGNDTKLFDAFADNCPFVNMYENLDCEDSTLQPYAVLTDFETYGYGAKAFTGTLYLGGALTEIGAYCFVPECILQADGVTYVLKVNIGSSYVNCVSQVSVNAPAGLGLGGVLNCPNPNQYCKQILSEGYCQGGCFGRGSCVDKACQCEDGWGFHNCMKKSYTDNCVRCEGEEDVEEDYKTSCYGDTCACNPANITCMCYLNITIGADCEHLWVLPVDDIEEEEESEQETEEETETEDLEEEEEEEETEEIDPTDPGNNPDPTESTDGSDTDPDLEEEVETPGIIESGTDSGTNWGKIGFILGGAVLSSLLIGGGIYMGIKMGGTLFKTQGAVRGITSTRVVPFEDMSVVQKYAGDSNTSVQISESTKNYLRTSTHINHGVLPNEFVGFN